MSSEQLLQLPPAPGPASGSLASSYAYCERLARREAANFYPAFRILPASQRRSMCALYAFMRVADDLADSPAPVEARRASLQGWRRAFDDALAGQYSHRLHPAFHHTVCTHHIPHEYLVAVLDGVEMDLDTVRYASFDDLYVYCWRVASAVGLACIHIWTFRDEQARTFAEKAGIAFQLTNILRDLRADALRGRVYLPVEDLERFHIDSEQLRTGPCDVQFRALMRFQVDRARSYYQAAQPLTELLPPGGRAVFQVMASTYRGLLDRMEQRNYDVFSQRIRLRTWQKLWFVLLALPVRCGLWG